MTTSSSTLARFSGLGFPALVACVIATMASDAVAAESPNDPWKQLEVDPRFIDCRERVRNGTFNPANRAFLTDVALPQIRNPENLSGIDRVRRRMRDLLVGESTLPIIFDYMKRVTQDEAEPQAVRINSLLLIGELLSTEGGSRGPWRTATEFLITTAGDASQPMFLRVTAVSTLDEQFAKSGRDTAKTLPPSLVPMLVTLIQDRSTGDAVASDWMAARALSMLAALGPNAPAEATTAAAAVLADDTRSSDVRVRAAAALGATAGEGRGVDAAASLSAIRQLALKVVSEERERARRESPNVPASAASGYGTSPNYGAPTSPGGGPGFPEGFPMSSAPGMSMPNPGAPPATPESEAVQLAFKRAAWRLLMLSTALEKPSVKQGSTSSGIAMVAGPLKAKVVETAKGLLKASTLINATPSVTSVDTVFKALGGSDASRKPQPGQQAAAVPGSTAAGSTPATEAAADPPPEGPPPAPQPPAANSPAQ